MHGCQQQADILINAVQRAIWRNGHLTAFAAHGYRSGSVKK